MTDTADPSHRTDVPDESKMMLLCVVCAFFCLMKLSLDVSKFHAVSEDGQTFALPGSEIHTFPLCDAHPKKQFPGALTM